MRPDSLSARTEACELAPLEQEGVTDSRSNFHDWTAAKIGPMGCGFSSHLVDQRRHFDQRLSVYCVATIEGEKVHTQARLYQQISEPLSHLEGEQGVLPSVGLEDTQTASEQCPAFPSGLTDESPGQDRQRRGSSRRGIRPLRQVW